MTQVERVKEACRERKIPLARLEKECGFANGYIGQLKKGNIPTNRLQKIADYLGIPDSYLLYGDSDFATDLLRVTEKDRELQTLLMEVTRLTADDRRVISEQVKRLRTYESALREVISQ